MRITCRRDRSPNRRGRSWLRPGQARRRRPASHGRARGVDRGVRAARYQQDHALARQVLLAQRRRFPLTARAAEASFLLGRLADDSPGGVAPAVAWYDRYLAEAPDGAYASEALGRKMMVLERSHRRFAATAVAADYLRRFPVGTYARAAEAIVGRR